MSKADKEREFPDMISEKMMKIAVSEAFQMENKIYDEWIKDVPDHEFSEEYYDKMKKLTGKNLNRNVNKEKQTSQRIPRVKLRYLLIAALLAALTCGTVMAVEPLREKVMQIIERRFSDHTDVTFEQVKDRMEKEKKMPDEFVKVEPAYVPEGYALESTDVDEDLYWYSEVYSNKEGVSFIFAQKPVEDFQNVSITSDGSKAEIVSINGKEGYLLQDEYGDCTLLFVQDGNVYMLAGTVEPETLIDIMKKTFE